MTSETRGTLLSNNALDDASVESSINVASAPLDLFQTPGLCLVLPVYFEAIYTQFMYLVL